jgi:hypothetical protein
MANGTLKSWADVQALLTANSGQVSGAPHQAFWDTLTYDQFINHCVPDPNGQAGGPPCVTDQNPPPPPNGRTFQILIKGNSTKSNIILALSGLPPFDGSVFQQMPDGGPYWTQPMIDELAAWIDAGCPK